MGIFNKINQRSGLVVGTIVVGLTLFLLGDALTSNNSLFSSFRNKVGEINGENISIEEYQKAIVKAEALYGGSGSNVNMEDMAWNQLIFDKVNKVDYTEAGIELSEEEKMDLLEGENRSEIIKQQFPGKDDLKKFLEYLDSDQIKSEEERENIKSRWRALKEYVFNDRLRSKYESVLKKSEYVTKSEGKRFYHTQNDKMEASYVYVPYYSIKDTIKVTDEMLQSYLDAHKNEYKVEQGRSIFFAVFNNTPSSIDSAYARKDLAKLKEEFKLSVNDSSFIRANSDNPTDPSVLPISQLPDKLSAMANSLQIDSVYGPFPQNTGYSLTKILKVENDTNVVARASHILFRFEATDTPEKKAEQKKKAEEVLKEIQSGASFAKMAAQYGGDGTASRGGDLGWFGKGQMVAPFQNAVFGASQPGVLPYIVETQFGYHIIRIDVPKTGRKYKVATIQKNIEAYQNTIDSIYRIADNFTALVKDTATFNAEAKKTKGATKFEQANIEGSSKSITGFSDAREVVKWLYSDDREIGDVSTVFTIENKNVVVLVVGMREKGFASIADVKDQIEPKVIIEEKAKRIKEKLTGTGDLAAVAKAYGTDALTGTSQDVILSSGMLTGVGYEPEAVGSLFGLTKGKRTPALTGDNGVLILQCVNFTPSEVADYNQFVTQLLQQRTARMGYGIIEEALRKSGDIVDMRYRF